MLAPVWESRFLEQLRNQDRKSRRVDRVNGVFV